MNAKKILLLLIVIFLELFSSGCAKYPDSAPTTGKQLVITLKVSGRIDPLDTFTPGRQRYYFIAIDNDGDPNTGPWAVVAPPFGGNGWVTSASASTSIGLTSFIEYDASNPSGSVYGVLSGSYFLNTTPAQLPISYEIVEGGSAIRFVIDFSQIATSTIPVDNITQLDINFITTDQLAINPDYTYPTRSWDALGPSGKDYVTIDTTSDRTYSSTVDPRGLVDPDLEITYWSIEVQSVSSR